MSTIEEELRLLAEVAKPLQKATDEANAAIHATNLGIQSLGAGVEVWLKDSEGKRLLLPGVDPETGYGHCLGVAKVKSAWQLCVRVCSVDFVGAKPTAGRWTGDSDQDLFPLTEASRDQRLAASVLLPALIRAVTSECQRLMDVRRQAAERPL